LGHKNDEIYWVDKLSNSDKDISYFSLEFSLTGQLVGL